MENKDSEQLNTTPTDECTQKVLEYYRKYSQNKELRKYLTGSPAEYIPRIEVTEADEEDGDEEQNPSRASSVMSRKLEWDNMADIGYENSEKQKTDVGTLKKSSSLPILSNCSEKDSKSSDMVIIIPQGDSSDSNRSVSSSENRIHVFANTLQYLKQKIGNPDAQSTPKFPELEVDNKRKEKLKSTKPKKVRNVVSLENIHIDVVETPQKEKSEAEEIKEFQKSSTIDLHVTEPVTIQCVNEEKQKNNEKSDKNSQTEIGRASKLIQTEKLPEIKSCNENDLSKALKVDEDQVYNKVRNEQEEFEIRIEKTKEINKQTVYFQQDTNSNSRTSENTTSSSSVTSKCNSFEFKKTYTPSSDKDSSQNDEKSVPNASCLRRSQRQSDLSHLKSKDYDSDTDTQIIIDSIISMSHSEAFNRSNAEIDKYLHLLEKLVKSKSYDDKMKKLYMKKIVKKIYNCLHSSESSEKSSSSSDLFCPKKITDSPKLSSNQKDDASKNNLQSNVPWYPSNAAKVAQSHRETNDKLEDDIIPVDARSAGKKLTRFTMTNNEFSAKPDSILQDDTKQLSSNGDIALHNPDSNESTLPSSNSNFNSTDSKKSYDNWRDDKTRSEQLLEKNNDLLLHFAKKERRNQLQWISNEINHLNKLKSLLQKDLSNSDTSSSNKKLKTIKKTTTYSINNNKWKGEAKNFVIETELPANINGQEAVEFKIGSNRYTVKELSENGDTGSSTTQKPSGSSGRGAGDGNRLVNEIFVNKQQDGTTKLKINTICKMCNKVPCVCIDESYKNVVCFCNNVNCVCKSAPGTPICNCRTTFCNCGKTVPDTNQKDNACLVCMTFPCICYDYSQQMTFKFAPKAPAVRPSTFPRSGSRCPCGRSLCNCDLIKRIEDFCNENMKNDYTKSEKTQTHQRRNRNQPIKDMKTQTCTCKCNCHPATSSTTSTSSTSKTSSNKKVMTSLKTPHMDASTAPQVTARNLDEPTDLSNQATNSSEPIGDNGEALPDKSVEESDKTPDEPKSSTTTCACCNRCEHNSEMAILVSEHRYPLCRDCLEKNPGVATICYDKNDHVCTCFTAVNSQKLKSQGDSITISDTNLIRIGKSTEESSDIESSSIASECSCYDYNNSIIISKNKNKKLCRYCKTKLLTTAKTDHGIAYTLTIENDQNVTVKKPQKPKHLEEIKLKVPHPYGMRKRSSRDQQSKEKLVQKNQNSYPERSDTNSSETKTLEIRNSDLISETNYSQYSKDKLYFPKASSSSQNMKYDLPPETFDKKTKKSTAQDKGKDSYLKSVRSTEDAEYSNETEVNTRFSGNEMLGKDFEKRELVSKSVESKYQEKYETDQRFESDQNDLLTEGSDRNIEEFDNKYDTTTDKKVKTNSEIICKKCKCKQILKDCLAESMEINRHEKFGSAKPISDNQLRNKNENYFDPEVSKENTKVDFLERKLDSQKMVDSNIIKNVDIITQKTDKKNEIENSNSKLSGIVQNQRPKKEKIYYNTQKINEEKGIDEVEGSDWEKISQGGEQLKKGSNKDIEGIYLDHLIKDKEKIEMKDQDICKKCNCKCRDKKNLARQIPVEAKTNLNDVTQSKERLGLFVSNPNKVEVKAGRTDSYEKLDSHRHENKMKQNLDIIIPRMDEELEFQTPDLRSYKIVPNQKNDQIEKSKTKSLDENKRHEKLTDRGDFPRKKIEHQSYGQAKLSNYIQNNNNYSKESNDSWDKRQTAELNANSVEKFTSTKIGIPKPKTMDNYQGSTAKNRPFTADDFESNKRYNNKTRSSKSDKIIQNNIEDNRSYGKPYFKKSDNVDFPFYTNEVYDSSNKKLQTKFEQKSKQQNGSTYYTSQKENEDSSLRRHLQKNRPKFLKNAETRRAIINACKEKRMRDMEQRRLDFYNLNKDKIDTKKTFYRSRNEGNHKKKLRKATRGTK